MNKVSGGTKTNPENYLCFPHYCSCTNFTYSVTKKEELLCVCHFNPLFANLQCKHQLAVILGMALDKCSVVEIDDIAFAKSLAQ